MATKSYYYIIVLNEGKAKFVTELNRGNRTARWDINGKPLAISRTLAQDIAYCLNLNFHPAYVIQSYYKIEEQIFCKEDEMKYLF